MSSAIRSRQAARSRERLMSALSKGLRERGLPFEVASAEFREDGSCFALLDVPLEHNGPPRSPERVAEAWLDALEHACSGGKP